VVKGSWVMVRGGGRRWLMYDVLEKEKRKPVGLPNMMIMISL